MDEKPPYYLFWLIFIFLLVTLCLILYAMAKVPAFSERVQEPTTHAYHSNYQLLPKSRL